MEEIHMGIVKLTAGAVTLLSMGSMAFADDWNWAPDREHGFYERFTRDPDPRPLKGDFDVRVGGIVPPDVEIYDAPPDYDYAPVREYRYVRHDKRVYVVEPKSRKVVRVIEK
jgi:hypothetical protein